MESNADQPELVRLASAGDRDSLSALAELARGRVRAYLRRVILHEDRAEDLTQEVMVAMLSSLGQFRDPLRFWPWVFTIASNKVRQSFRRADFQPAALSEVQETRLEPRSDEPEPVEGLSRRELAEHTRAAMADLDVRYRMVLAMRFYEDLPHAAIGHVLGCSEMSARVTFLRAKRALVRALHRRGVSQATLAAALLAFGQATYPARAESLRISASALREGLQHLLVTRAVPALAAALLLAVIFWPKEAPANRAAAPSVVTGIHFIEQSLAAASTELPFKAIAGSVSYRIDLERDLVEQMMLTAEGTAGPSMGTVRFEYLQDLTGLEHEFMMPAVPPQASGSPVAQGPGPLWPLMLFE